jgi:hypothetical protein
MRGHVARWEKGVSKCPSKTSKISVPDFAARDFLSHRGALFVAAVTVLAEIGDLSRFQNPRELMGYLGHSRSAPWSTC